MPELRARRATSAATPPKPMSPSVLPVSWTPSIPSHRPARIPRSIVAKPLADINAMAHSACSVDIALVDVNGHAVPGQLFGVHIATRAGAEENDVPEASAFGGDQRWQRSVIDYRNLGVAEQGRELVRGHIAIAIDGDRRVPVAPQFFGDTGEGIVGVGKNSAQCHLPVLVRSLQC